MFCSPVFDLFSGSWNPPHVAGNADRADSKQPVDSQSRTDPEVATCQQLSSRLYVAPNTSLLTHLAVVVLHYYSLCAQGCAVNLYACAIQGIRFPCLHVNTLDETFSKGSKWFLKKVVNCCPSPGGLTTAMTAVPMGAEKQLHHDL